MSFRALAKAATATLAAVLAGCSTVPPLPVTPPTELPVDRSFVARGQDSRALFLVLHYTVADFKDSLNILTKQEVSAHYLVSDETPPKIYQLVDESRRAWHSGPSFWRGHRMLNASSIGIEIVHPGNIKLPQGTVWPAYRDDQMDLVVQLVQDIVKRHNIRPERVVGHSDVLPQDKQDPGPRFPWKRLADLGLIPWPDAARVAELTKTYEAQLPDVRWFQRGLATHGFEITENGVLDAATRNVLIAFQMKYRPSRFDGTPDAETAALLHALITPEPRR